MYILINDTSVINVDSESEKNVLIANGWHALTPEQVESAGMVGYEQLVSPLNTTINDEGTITFTPPEPPSNVELFSHLRSERDVRLSAVLWMRERHSDELELGTEPTLTPEQYTALLTYIQALRDIPAQPGAPWDGGGELTPWPELPSVE